MTVKVKRPTTMIEKNRIDTHNNFKLNRDGKYFLYWMHSAQRIKNNHALSYAIKMSNKYNLPLLVCFFISESYPMANLRHFTFMLESLSDIKKKLSRRSIIFRIFKVNPATGCTLAATDAAAIISEKGMLKIHQQWIDKIISKIKIPFHTIDTNTVVPIKVASQKEEYGAYTIRPKIHKVMNKYLKNISIPKLKNTNIKDITSIFKENNIEEINLNNINDILINLDIDNSVPPSTLFKGGERQAIIYLKSFIKNKLVHYSNEKNIPHKNIQSQLSPYLHFGNISPITIALEVIKSGVVCSSFIEELVVRRELAINFVSYNKNYDKYSSIPSWAIKTLNDHKDDKREYTYSIKKLENALTHDKYWNACQREMLITGKMNGYMRMYWGKKIIEWSKTPQYAFKVITYLNDKYELDGRDPNGYSGIAWCFGKHDRPWKERSIFGKIRYMNSKGLERKFDMKKYIEYVDGL